MTAFAYCVCMAVAIAFCIVSTVSWNVHRDMYEEYMRTVNRPDTIEDEEQREKT